MHALDSKVMLYGQNVWQAIGAISRVMNGVQNEIFGDEISEKGNTMRRVAEQLLKIECSFREIIPRKAYNQLLLKDLIALLKEHHNRIFNWGRIAQLTNHLSHDSGKPKIKEELIELIVLILDYANELRALVTSRPTPKKPSK
ncbi:MAG TPA: hypothetical protein DCM05_06195 [Elusimicrobia bacterium]|nr:hypothetical protein [Elusimicrobiota bacterium]